MYLSENQAAILITGRSHLIDLTCALVTQHLNRLKSSNTGQESILLDTGAKLYYYSTDKFKFYISGYRDDECDVISLYDYLELSTKYFRLLLKREGYTPKEVEKLKLILIDYEENRLRKNK